MSKQALFVADRLPAWFPLHHFNQPVYHYSTGLSVLDWSQTSLWAFVAMTAFNPIFWNTVARNEFHNKTITKIVKSPYVGCYILAATIFSLSAFRDSLFIEAVKNQPAMAILDHPIVKALAVGFFASGQIFVLGSMWVLGVTGTYLGDYFGILMSHRVTGFPFNALNDPMYVGSFMTHIGTALWFQSPTGVVLAFYVLAVYMAALRFEGPFTDMIYSAASKKTDPATPRKSSRIAKASERNEAASYAQAAAQPPAADGLPDMTPRRSGRIAAVQEDGGANSPMRMTRNRSKGRGLGSDGE